MVVLVFKVVLMFLLVLWIWGNEEEVVWVGVGDEFYAFRDVYLGDDVCFIVWKVIVRRDRFIMCEY